MEKVLQIKIENSQRKILKAKHAIEEQEKIIKDETENIELWEKHNQELNEPRKEE